MYSITIHGGHGEAVQLYVLMCLVVSRSSVNLPSPRASRAVNASELERLKKRFMKLDRCAHCLLATLCPTAHTPNVSCNAATALAQ